VRKQFVISLCALALAAATAACSGGAGNANSANNTNAANANNANASSGGPVAAPDGSQIVRTEEGGVVTETRTFGEGRIERVVVSTRDGRRTARVYARDGEIRDLPEGKVESALTETGENIAEAAGFLADKGEEAAGEIGDKAEDVGDAAKRAGETAADKTRAGVREAGDKAEDVGDKAKSGARKAASGAKKVGSAVKDKITP
jgi:hypothetical protein